MDVPPKELTRTKHHLPHCHKAFTIDEAGYADIVAKVRAT